MTDSTVWAKLKDIDVNQDKEKKDRYDYLSWTHAIRYVKDVGCSLDWEVEEDVYFPDGSMEVRMKVIIDGIALPMWLPVMNHRNQGIKNPNATDINKARMRCLVKGIAAHGLGFYIYAGEDLPLTSPHELYDDMQARILTDRYDAAIFMMTQPEEVQTDIFKSAPPGEVAKFKALLREIESEASQVLKEIAVSLESGADVEDELKVKQEWTELSREEKKLVWGRLNPLTHDYINAVMGKREAA